jgi:hypothetical protein
MTKKERMEKQYGPQYPGDNKFTAKARMLQSIYRVMDCKEISMGVGPNEHPAKGKKPAYYGNMLVNGEITGKNFLFPETFEYAKKRVLEKKPRETIDKYRLFNNLLSSMPMTFNLFHPLMMLKEKFPFHIAEILRSVFPGLPIYKVDDILIEFIPTPIKNYTNDKTAMDAAILFSDTENRKYLIAIEVKYTDSLGSNKASDNESKFKIASESGLFTVLGLAKVKENCPQIYRNFLLTEKYRMVHKLEDSYSFVLAPKGHPTTETEIKSLKNYLKREHKYKIESITLEDFMEELYEVCPYEFLDWIGKFRDRYLNFNTIDMVK